MRRSLVGVHWDLSGQVKQAPDLAVGDPLAGHSMFPHDRGGNIAHLGLSQPNWPL
jgi:hypothetical protein